MLINKNARNINFGLKVTVSNDAYFNKPLNALRDAGKYVGGPFTLKEAKFLDSEGYTKGMRICSGGILTAPDSKEFYMFHLNPENFTDSWQDICNALDNAQKRIEKVSKEPLETLVLGANRNNILSMGLAGRLIEFFQKKGIKLSALIGQSADEAALHYSLPKNEATVSFVGAWKVKHISDLRKDFATVIPGKNEFRFSPEASL